MWPSSFVASFCRHESRDGFSPWAFAVAAVPRWHHWPSVNTVDIEDSLLGWLLIICANSAEHKPLLSVSVLPSFRLRSSQFSR